MALDRPHPHGLRRHDVGGGRGLGVVFQKERWTTIAVTLGLVLVASIRQAGPMTFIAVRCPHCPRAQIGTRGKTARGPYVQSRGRHHAFLPRASESL